MPTKDRDKAAEIRKSWTSAQEVLRVHMRAAS